MAQQARKDDELIEIDTSTDVGFEFSFKWPVRTPEAIDAFVKCDPEKPVTSAIATSSFNLNGEEINFDWYVAVYPNGRPLLKGASGLVIAETNIGNMPRAKTVDIKVLTISHMISLPELHILHKGTSDFGHDPPAYMAFSTIHSGNKIKSDIFTKYNVVKRKGFDIIAKICIEKIQFAKKAMNKITSHETSLSKNDNYNGSGKDIGNIVNMLKEIQLELKKISAKLNDNSNIYNAYGNISTGNELEEWILNIFSGNEEFGKKYVKIIIENEGFDDIDVFCNLNANDLKEMGIDKKGHRMKIMQKIREYTGKKIQSLMANNNINAKVAPGAALDVQETEGKE